MAQKILAIDTGTNSLGYVVRNPDSESDSLYDQFERIGVVVFPKGVGEDVHTEFSLASARREKRSARKLYQVRKYRLWETLETLIQYGYCPLSIEELEKWKRYNKEDVIKRSYPVGCVAFDQWVKLDFDGDGVPDYTNPYELRKELVTVQLDFTIDTNRYKLGRALYHIAQRRGFRSSKGETLKEGKNKADEVFTLKKSEERKSVAITEYIERYNITPNLVCVALAQIAASGDRVRKEYQIVRSQYSDEVRFLFNFQEDLSVTDQFYIDVIKAVFYQRKKSKKGEVGKCTLEPNKYRCSIGHYAFEEFRAWSFINNIKCDGESLSIEIKRDLYKDLFIGKLSSSFKFQEIREWLQKKRGKEYSVKDKTINFKDTVSVQRCSVSAQLKRLFGDDWQNYSVDRYKIEDIWHILDNIEDSEWLMEFAINKLKLDDKKIEYFMRLNVNMPIGYSMLSHKAIVNINRFLKKGLIYTDAVFIAKLPDIFGSRWNDEIEAELFSEICLINEYIRKKKKVYNIVNALIAAHKSLANEEVFGKNDKTYKLDKSDFQDVEKYSKEAHGDKSWDALSATEKQNITDEVSELYQQYFASSRRKYMILPQIGEAISEFIKKNYNISEFQTSKLYHPSKMDYYPPVSEDSDGDILLGSPIIDAFKNPVAVRSLFQIRNVVNHLLRTGVIDTDTRVVVELSRDVNDANMRRAIARFQAENESENKEIIKIIREIYDDSGYLPSNAEISKVRLLVEQWDITEHGSEKIAKTKTKKDKIEYHKLENLITKIKLWEEQQYRCIYTGNMISMKDLFAENIVDIEHTIPRSLLLDNSLANKTICYANFNRNVKQGRIPANLNNYKEILDRITPWRERVEKLEDNVNYWISRSKNLAGDKEKKDDAIVNKHVWQMKLDYWRDKVSRFLMTEVSSGFRHSQLVDNRIISKYAMHYLKSVFKQVDVQKGIIVSDFRKIIGAQNESDKKNRSLHTHHAIDATILSLIPKAPVRDRMLELYYKIKEAKRMNQDASSFERKLQKERYMHGIGSFSGIVEKIESTVLINHRTKNVVLSSAKKKTTFDGKLRVQTGDSMRGQIHAETFYGAIKPAICDNNGEAVRGDDGQYIQQEGPVYVVRRELKFKNKSTDVGFSVLAELLSKIVDKKLGEMIERQVDELYEHDYSIGEQEMPLSVLKDEISQVSEDICDLKKVEKGGEEEDEEGKKNRKKESDIIKGLKTKLAELERRYASYFKKALEKGVYKYDRSGYLVTVDKNGRKLNPIRHIRCIASDVKNPIVLKRQTYASKHDYKNNYYVGVGELYCMCRYVSKGKDEIIYKPQNLFQISENRRNENRSSYAEHLEKNGITYILDKVIKKGTKVLIWIDSPSELRSLELSEISKRLYIINNFEADGRVSLVHHLSAKQDKDLRGRAINHNEINLPEKIRTQIKNLKCIYERDDFDFTIDGKILFKES